jgi:hypothetical protein
MRFGQTDPHPRSDFRLRRHAPNACEQDLLSDVATGLRQALAEKRVI